MYTLHDYVCKLIMQLLVMVLVPSVVGVLVVAVLTSSDVGILVVVVLTSSDAGVLIIVVLTSPDIYHNHFYSNITNTHWNHSTV